MARSPEFPEVQPGAIVWCRFPASGIPGPGPKTRPALVVRTGDIDGVAAVEVAYGTSQRVDDLFPGEFSVTPDDGEAFRLSGLSYPTKFDLSRRVELPFNKRWLAVAPGAPFGQTPQMGILHPVLVRRAAAAYKATR